MIRSFCALLVVCVLTGPLTAQDEAVLGLYKKQIEMGLANLQEATPKLIEWTESEKLGVAVKSVECLEIIGKKFKKSDRKADNELRLQIVKALVRAEGDTRKEVKEAAAKALPNMATEKELKEARKKKK